MFDKRFTTVIGAERTDGHQDLLQMDTGAIDSFEYSCRAKNLTPKTLRYYCQNLKYLGIYAESIDKPLIQLEHSDIRAYLMSLMDRLQASSVNARIRTYKVFYRYLTENCIIASNPMQGIVECREPRKIKPVITPEEFAKVLKQFPTDRWDGYRDMVATLLMYDCMLRLNELLTLELDDLTFKPHRTLKVFGKGRRERMLSFSYKTAEKLMLYIHIHRKDIPGDLLFPTRSGKELHDRNFYRSLHRASVKAGIKVNPHLLRHSAATTFAQRCPNIFMLQQILGHTDIRTSQLYYHGSVSEIIKAYEKISPVEGLNI